MAEMKDFWQVVESRRSVRQYKKQPVNRRLLEKVIEAGTRAPNAHNRQSWRFVVITQKEVMARLAEEMSIEFHQTLLNSGTPALEAQARVEKRRQRLTGAPVVVVLFVETADLDHYSDEHRGEGEYLMAVQSAALAGGHMLLAAEALELAGVWMCAPLFAPERVRSALDLPDSWMAQGLLLLGYPDEWPELRQRKPLADLTRWY